MKPHIHNNQPRRVNHSQPYRFRHPNPAEHCLAIAALIRSMDLTHQLPRRNALATENFKCLDFRKFTYTNLTQLLEYTVESWWDTATKSWVTQVKDFGDGQIGNTTYGYASSAALNHFSAIADVFLGVAPKSRESEHTYTIRHDDLRTLHLHGLTAEVAYQFLRAVPHPNEYSVTCDKTRPLDDEAMGGDEWLEENPQLCQCPKCGAKYDSFLGLCECPVHLAL